MLSAKCCRRRRRGCDERRRAVDGRWRQSGEVHQEEGVEGIIEMIGNKNAEIQRRAFLDALGGTERISSLIAGDETDPLFEFLKCDVEHETSTIDSYFRIKRDNPNWLSTFSRKRLADEQDRRNLNAALGELRAYADLLELPFIKVEPHASNQGGTDFLVKNNANSAEIAKVEVFTQNPKPYSTDVIEESESHSGDGFVFKTKIREVTPFSNKMCFKIGDTTALDAISKICSIKQKEEQIDEKVPTLYYVDLQTIIPAFSTLFNYKPISSFSGAISSGAYWHAIYGRRGDMVAEGLRIGNRRVAAMMHNGRFADNPLPSKACAFLFRENRTSKHNEDPLVCFENPSCPLPEFFAKSLSCSPLLNWEMSVMRMIQCDLENYINLQNDVIQRCISYMKS